MRARFYWGVPEAYRTPERARLIREGFDPAHLLDVCTIDPDTGCWIWPGATRVGYGTIKVGGKMWLTHRLAYQTWVGPIPAGMVIDHLCTVRACCNPAHLEPVTTAANTQRDVQRRQGLPLSPADAAPKTEQGLVRIGRYQPTKDEHGTRGGYRRHQRLGEQACRACTDAQSAYNAAAKRAQRARRLAVAA